MSVIYPDLLLPDEPTAGLAPKAIDMIFEKIEVINDPGVILRMIEQNVKRAFSTLITSSFSKTERHTPTATPKRFSTDLKYERPTARSTEEG